MNLRSLPDQMLLSSTEKLVAEERHLLIEILHRLREIERRRLFADLGCSSLFAYCTEKLGYSNDQAARRISAMRLLKELPQLEEKLQTGAVSLTKAAMAQSYFKHEERAEKPLSAAEKLDVLRDLENKSTREAELQLRGLNPKPAVEDRVKPLDRDLVEIRFSAPRELEEKLQKLKGLLAHSDPRITLADLVGKLADLALKEWDPGREPKRAANRKTAQKSGAPRVDDVHRAHQSELGVQQSPPEMRDQPKSRRHIPKAIEREVWRRDHGRCQICNSRHGLELDHSHPVAFGGETTLDNLTLLCRACNQRAAIHSFGLEHMEPYLAPR